MKIRTIFFTIVILSFTCASSAFALPKTSLIGGDGGSMFSDACISGDGSYVAVGMAYSSNGKLWTVPKDSQNAALIAKYDAHGELVYAHCFQNPPLHRGITASTSFSKVSPLQDGGVVAVGAAYGVQRYFLSARPLSFGAFLVRYNSDGTSAFQTVWRPTDSGELETMFPDIHGGGVTFYDVVGTSDGGYAAVGYASSAQHPFWEQKGPLLVKFGAQNQVEWAQTYDMGNDAEFRADGFDFVKVNQNGEFVVGCQDGRLMKISADGEPIWINESEFGRVQNAIHDMELLSDGMIILTSGLADYGLLAYSPDGKLKRILEKSGDALCATNDGGFALLTNDWNYSRETNQSTQPGYSSITKFDAEANEEYTFLLTKDAFLDGFYAIAELRDEGFMAAGSVRKNLDFGDIRYGIGGYKNAAILFASAEHPFERLGDTIFIDYGKSPDENAVSVWMFMLLSLAALAVVLFFLICRKRKD